MQPITVALFGISGSGKGTQARLLEKFLREKDSSRDVLHPVMGDLLREYMVTGTPLARKVQEIVENGGLVPSFVAAYLMVTLADKSFDGSQHLLFDGTCRKPDQSRMANDLARLWGRTDLHAIVLKLSKETAKQRLGGRGRADDIDEETVERRFSWYNEWVVPSIAELKILGWAVHEVDSEGDIDAIHKNILSMLGLVK